MSIRCERNLRCMLKCAFDISCTDMEVYIELLKRGQSIVEELAEALKKDNSTIYKSLQTLLDKGLVKRDYKILRTGGYRYVYRPIEFEKLKQEIIKNLQSLIEEVTNFLKELEKYTEEKVVQSLTIKEQA
ncbi:MAG: ArsR family transcriptional regulator [Archaeoglobaceae archaeon]|nr:ArsR family transcriptional regulator [Archaeoglobaceae archaeon]MCX8152646.1 ArsR family transcriptional regulator [Archaeoglobaceae archaeon]MDW8014072.1 helix-turn-helix domain-containing protein [Archaeoglobaceae archaeon]